MVPIYESIGALGPRMLRRLMWTALEGIGSQIPDRLPASVVAKNKLVARARPSTKVTFRRRQTDLEKLCSFRTPAQVRMIFEEFFSVGAGLALKRRKAQGVAGSRVQSEGQRPPGDPQDSALPSRPARRSVC